jgi:hypothetical protein
MVRIDTYDGGLADGVGHLYKKWGSERCSPRGKENDVFPQVEQLFRILVHSLDPVHLLVAQLFQDRDVKAVLFAKHASGQCAKPQADAEERQGHVDGDSDDEKHPLRKVDVLDSAVERSENDGVQQVSTTIPPPQDLAFRICRGASSQHTLLP